MAVIALQGALNVDIFGDVLLDRINRKIVMDFLASVGGKASKALAYLARVASF